MGVRTLIGEADGTKRAAAMYDSVSGWMIGPIWEADDAPEQIEAFLQWMRQLGPVSAIENGTLVLDASDLPYPTRDETDARCWPDSGLKKIIAHWRKLYVDDEGWLKHEVAHG